MNKIGYCIFAILLFIVSVWAYQQYSFFSTRVAIIDSSLKLNTSMNRTYMKGSIENYIKDLEKQKVKEDQSLKIFKSISYTSGIIGICSLLIFLRSNKSALVQKVNQINLRRIALLSNTILILAASWHYTKHDRLVLTAALTLCAIINAYLVFKPAENHGFTEWATYTIAIFLLASGLRLIDGYYWERNIGIVAIIVGLINSYYRFYLNNKKANISKQS